MQSINIEVQPKDEYQIEVLKSFMKTLKIKFKISKEINYNKDFVDKITKADKEIKEGKGVKLTSEEFDNLWK